MIGQNYYTMQIVRSSILNPRKTDLNKFLIRMDVELCPKSTNAHKSYYNPEYEKGKYILNGLMECCFNSMGLKYKGT